MPGYISFTNLPFRESPGDTINALRGARNSGAVNHWLWQPRDRVLGPEESLLADMLLMAIHDYRNSKHVEQQKDAARWFADTGEETFFTFEGLCSVLKINPGWFRKELAREH